VLVVGDSNLFESSASVDAAIRGVGLEPTLRGIPGFGLKDLDGYWLGELPALLASDPAVVVVALGTNDTTSRADVDAFPDRIDAMMRSIGDRPVVWVTHVDPRPAQVEGGAAAINAAIRDAPARWPNLTVLDRAPALAADPSLLGDDGLHFTDTGQAAFADEIANAVRARVPGTG
jgi:lysophospholipase L1-like esterase